MKVSWKGQDAIPSGTSKEEEMTINMACWLGVLDGKANTLKRLYDADMSCLDALDKEAESYEADAIEILTRMLSTRTEMRAIRTTIDTIRTAEESTFSERSKA